MALTPGSSAKANSEAQASDTSNAAATASITGHSLMFPLEFPTMQTPDATSSESTSGNKPSTPNSITIQWHRYPQRIDNRPIGTVELTIHSN